MADPRLRPRGVKPSTTNGDLLTTVGGVAAWAPLAVPPPLVSRLPGGDPGLVFDSDGEVVHTEVLP